MTKEYKPERPVTSAKIRQKLSAIASLTLTESIKYPKNHTDLVERKRIYCLGNPDLWKRMWKRRLPESRGFIRGFYNNSVADTQAVAISDHNDRKLISVYYVTSADEECKKLGINEVMMAD
jgi:hypothetical protein